MVTHPTFVVGRFAGGSGPGGGFTPAQMQTAYGFGSISFNGTAGTGSGETIAIVDAYDNPNIQSDLNTFDSYFGLPATTVTRVNQTGGTSYPPTDPTGGWELEEALDVEWAHAMAPGASIMLVEASSANGTDLLAAVNYAAAHANVVSMSWGGNEFSGENGYDSAYFDQPGVAFVASSGDSGAPASWPAASPNVLSVGGTALTVDASNAWSREVGWSGSGGGPSAYESQPSYQTGVVSQTSSARATPDVAYDASVSTGVDVYDSVPYNGQTRGWVVVGGTSAGAPQWSALLAIADQGRALSGQSALDSTNPQEVMNILYSNPSDFHDITSGTSTGNPNYSAGPGYDYVTGMGTPIANLVVGSLVGTPPTTATASFIRQDTTTQGNWIGTYGSQGYDVIGNASSLPSYATVTPAGQQNWTWAANSSDPRALEDAGGSGRIAACWYSPTSFTVNVNLTDGQTHDLELYFVDWDSTTRAQQVQISNASTGAVLDTENVTSFNSGKYLNWAVSGNLLITITNTGSPNAVLSGLFLGSTPAAPPTPESIWGTSYSPTVNASYKGTSPQTFELGVQFESNIAGEVTGVLFYKQRGTTGTNVGHLWSSNGTLLASATFSNETSSGWQQVSFSSPVAIQANTIYTVSYDTGSRLFYYESGYFSRGGVTNGNLTAPASTTINNQVLDNGVYNYGGEFPNSSQYSANFWVDVAFSPSGSSSPSVKTGRSAAVAIGPSGYIITSPGSATPAGPIGAVPGSRGTSPSTARRPSVSFPVVSYRSVVRQARALVLWGQKATSLLT
jgi:Domain of unknown function (DUF4082)